MKLSEFRNTADYFTGKASEISRQLIIAGIGIVWLFKTTINGKDVIDKPLILPLIFLGFAALLDLLQYVIGGFTWTRFFLNEEQKINNAIKNNPSVKDNPTVIDPETQGPKNIGEFLNFFYFGKIIVMIIAYGLILIYLFRYLSFK